MMVAEARIVSGLICDVIGVMLLPCFAPEKFSDPQWRAFFTVKGESKKARERWRTLQPIRRVDPRPCCPSFIVPPVSVVALRLVAADGFRTQPPTAETGG